jgi:hypothetical protein
MAIRFRLFSAIASAAATVFGGASSAPFHLLRRAFLRRFLDNELLSFGADAGPQVWLWLAALGLAPGILQPVGWMAQYEGAFAHSPGILQEMRWGHSVALIQLSMASTAIATALAWEALLLDRRDVLILSPLPLSWRTICGAKVTALLIAWVGLALAVNLPPSLLFALVAHAHGGFLSFFVTHFAAAMAASALVFAALIALQALLLNTLSASTFRRLVTVVQAIALFAALLLLLLRPTLRAADWPRALADGSWLLWFPPIWFLGLAETMRGTALAGFHDAARIALLAFGGCVTIAGVGVVAGFRRHVRRVVESPEMGTRGLAGHLGQAARRVAHLFVRHPVERATFDFTVRSLARSPRHRLLLGGAIGLGVALSLPALLTLFAFVRSEAVPPRLPGVGLLAIPLMLSFLLMLTLRLSFRLPTDIGAAWVMRLIANDDARVYLAGTRKAMFAVGVIAPQLPLVPCYALVWGPVVALQHALVCGLMGLLLMNLLMASFHSVPFTSLSTGIADPRPAIWPLLPLALATYCITTAGIEARLLDQPVPFAAACLVLVMLNAAAAWRRRRRVDGSGLVFDIEPADASIALNLATAPRA